MLGQPVTMLIPQVVGYRLDGELAEGATATDLVLTVTEMLREKGVVGKFVEFFGEGLDALSLADRATIANMAPEYGATVGFFPVDDRTLDYMRLTGRDDKLIDIARRVKEYVAEARARMPPGIELATRQDYSEQLASRRDLLLRNGGQGILLVLIALALFLRARLAAGDAAPGTHLGGFRIACGTQC